MKKDQYMAPSGWVRGGGCVSKEISHVFHSYDLWFEKKPKQSRHGQNKSTMHPRKDQDP